MQTNATNTTRNTTAGPRRYCAVNFNAYPIDSRHAVVASPVLDGVRLMRGLMPTVMGWCRIPRTIEDHAAVISAGVRGLDSSAVADTLDALLSAGLLREVEDAPPDPVTSSSRVSVVGVLTGDKPEALERCLRSYLTHFENCGRRPPVLVVDYSASAIAASRNRAVLQAARGQYAGEIRYTGHDARLALRARLLHAGASPVAVRGLLGADDEPSSWGIANNSLSLLTSGEVVLVVDDDTLCVPWTAPDAVGSIEVAGHADPCMYQFFDNRHDATATAPVECDLLAAHEQLIGRAVADFLDIDNRVCEVRHACPDVLVAASTRQAGAQIRVTASGVAGDLGLGSPHSFLLASAHPRVVQSATTEDYERALAFREVRRIVSRPTITHQACWMAHCVAFDNRTLLPPFLRSASGTDGLFGTTLGRCDPSGLFGYVPVGIVHDSNMSSEYVRGFGDAWRVDAASVLAGLVSAAPLTAVVTAIPERMRRIALHVADVASLAGDEFNRLVRAMALESKARELGWMDRVGQDPTLPAPWRGGVARYRAAFLATVERPDAFLPEDGSLQRSVAEFAAALREWPDVASSARESANAEVHTGDFSTQISS